MGQLDVLQFLHFKGADLLRTDVNDENGIHWAARRGHNDVLKFLQEHGLTINDSNKYGDTPLHLASREGYGDTVELLTRQVVDVNQQNEEGDTALHFAATHGHLDCARHIVRAGANANIKNKLGCTALHLALRKHHIAVAIMLLQSGCNIEILDDLGEAAIHIVAREGLLPIAQTLCAFGCKVEIKNKAGQYPLHLAARNGHTELVRCLCLAGCDVDLRDNEGIAPEICAMAQGYNEMADILNKLRNTSAKEEFISQLIPSTEPISRIKLKLFGHSGVGKSTFVENIKCGYFTSWFKRSVGSMSPTLARNKKGVANKFIIELNNSGSTESQLHFDTCFDTYTHGISVQNVNLSGIGNFSIWEFSGHEPYFMTYDSFIGNTNCLHLVFFSLSDDYEVQLQQVLYWLAFLQSRIPVQEPLGYCGKSGKPAKVVLLATHADTAACHKVAASGEYVSSEASSVLQIAQIKFGAIFDLHDTVFVLDGSPTMKALKMHFAQCKDKLTQDLPKTTGFLEAVCSQLRIWRKSRVSFPAMPWENFIDLVHSNVNPLAGEEHMKELIQQLQIMGEVLYIACEAEDIIILEPAWLCGTIIGYLLSQENLDKARVTGIYSADDVQLLFPEADVLKLLSVLEALQLCTKCETEDDVEYEFPCFNMMEMMDGIWNVSPSQFSCYGGVKLTCRNKPFLGSIFSKVQVNFRKLFKEHVDTENDLYQWCQGSKFCCGRLESLITVNDRGSSYDIKVRGPGSMKSECFFFQEDLIFVVEQVFSDVCPGFSLERHVYSSSQLQSHSKFVYTYSPNLLMKTLIKDGIYATVYNEQTNTKETLITLLWFGDPGNIRVKKHSILKETSPNHKHTSHKTLPRSKTFSSLAHHSRVCRSNTQQRRQSLPQNTSFWRQSSPEFSYKSQVDNYASAELSLEKNAVVLVTDLHAAQLSLLCIQCLCSALDLQDSMGRDWCMLGVLLGITDKLPRIDPVNNPAFSPTACILHEWMKQKDNTLGQLLLKLTELERSDASEALIPMLPLFEIEQPNQFVFSKKFTFLKE